MENSELNKLIKLANYFTDEYSYQILNVEDYIITNEFWLYNLENDYKLIRISSPKLQVNDNIDDKYILKHMDSFLKEFKLDSCTFLDIHICNSEIDDYMFEHISIDDNYYSGIDVTNIYPDIRNVFNNENIVRHDINMSDINPNSIKMKIKRKLGFAKVKYPFIVTYSTIAICIISFILNVLLNNKYSNAASLIFMGGDYKMFTLGLNQFWRLFTYAFSHGSLLHLTMNMISLQFLGLYVEHYYGPNKTILLIVFSIIVAGLSNGILNTNSLTIGMSGAIYALFVTYIFHIITTGFGISFTMIVTVLINIGLNFMPNVSWQAHLGGAIIGILFGIYNEDKMKHFIALSSIIVLMLGYKYYSIDTITPIYGGTDAEVIQIYKDFKLKNLASKWETKLYTIYMNNGKIK